MEICLIRHTAVYNPDKLCYGQSDIALSPHYKQDFEALKQKLGEQAIGTVFYASPFKRCTDLADFLSPGNFKTDNRLSEMNFGEWEQVPWTAIKPDELNPWMADFVNVTVPGGESFKTMHQRCQQFWNELIGHDIKNVVIITHAGFIRSILSHILEIPLNKVFQLDVDYGSVTKITASGEHGSYQQVLYINR